MSRSRRNTFAGALQWRRHAPLFAALGDETRLKLVARLCRHSPSSISKLSHGMAMTRQAITLHLQVLEKVGIVRGAISGRERLFQLTPQPLTQARDYLELVSAQWDTALSRLRDHVEATR